MDEYIKPEPLIHPFIKTEPTPHLPIHQHETDTVHVKAEPVKLEHIKHEPLDDKLPTPDPTPNEQTPEASDAHLQHLVPYPRPKHIVTVEVPIRKAMLKLRTRGKKINYTEVKETQGEDDGYPSKGKKRKSTSEEEGFQLVKPKKYTIHFDELNKGAAWNRNTKSIAAARAMEVQPFRLKVHTNALIVMDLHSHLMTTEIIGFLAGFVDAQNKRVTVSAAYPCSRLAIAGALTNVEMDPVSAIQVREEIYRSGMEMVGWYHSHPTFTADPSQVDITNHSQYQNLFIQEDRDPKLRETFVGAIVSTFYKEAKALKSHIGWFHTTKTTGIEEYEWETHSLITPENRPCRAMSLYKAITADEMICPRTRRVMYQLIDDHSSAIDREKLLKPWRGRDKLDKMITSLSQFTKDMEELESLRERLHVSGFLYTPDEKAMAESLNQEVWEPMPAEWNTEGASQAKAVVIA